MSYSFFPQPFHKKKNRPSFLSGLTESIRDIFKDEERNEDVFLKQTKNNKMDINQPKRLAAALMLLVAMLFGISCQKDPNNKPPIGNNELRKVQFVLYTDKDFSSDNNIIAFKLSIQKSNNLAIWDSVLAPMQIKDIPSLAQKLVIEKLVPGNDQSLLKVGFYYTIRDVGDSWHIEAFEPGQTLKVVDFNFQ